MTNRTLLIATTIVTVTAGSLVYAQSLTPDVPLAQDIQNLIYDDAAERGGKDCNKDRGAVDEAA